MIIKKCRNCKSLDLTKLFSLGKMCFTGKFPRFFNNNIPKSNLSLIICNSCQLVQLKEKFNQNYLYGNDYGYKSGVNQTMKNHLKGISKLLSDRSNLKKGDYVLDIASNDGTLLNSYKKNGIIKVGVDPILKKFSKYYKRINFSINNFFSYNVVRKKINKKFKVITACAVFYDLNDPNKFLKDISNLIDINNGIFYLEFQDLLSIIKNRLFDTICHEHLEYYSLSVIKNMIINNNLKLIDATKNLINGGSLSLIITHKESRYKINNKKINKLLFEEKKYKLSSKKTYINFYNQILKIKKKITEIISIIKSKNKSIHGYGASTKGNVLLQFFKIKNSSINYIADRNIEKSGLYTPGTKIKIITENESRLLKPDYYLVLPWHFKKEILLREKQIRKSGTKFIFPLPKLKII